MRTVEPIPRRRSRSLDDEPLVNSGIPPGRLGNRTFPNASEARRAAISEANRLNQTAYPGHSVARSDAHRPGELPHYHVIDPQGDQISGHFFYGRKPYRVEPGREGNPKQSIAAATRDLNPLLLSWQEEYQRLQEKLKTGQANRQEKGRLKWLNHKIKRQKRDAQQLGTEIYASRQSKQKAQREQEGEMNQQSQWLFEMPFVSEFTKQTNYSNFELIAEGEVSQNYNQAKWLFEVPENPDPSHQLAEEWELDELTSKFAGDPEGIVDSIFGKIGDIGDWGKEQFVVRQAILAGNRDENQLTSLVFFARHPKRQGRKLSKDEPNFPQLSQEWVAIRDRIIRPILDTPTTGVKPLPTGSACVKIPRSDAPALIRKLAEAVERTGTLTGFTTFALAVAYTESRCCNCAINRKDAPSACRLYKGSKKRGFYATNPFREEDWCFGSGGWFGFMPATGLAAGGPKGLFAKANPQLIHDPVVSVVMLADFVERIIRKYGAKNWLAVRRGMASPKLVSDYSETKHPRSKKVRERFTEALMKNGISNPEDFMKAPVSIKGYSGAAKILNDLQKLNQDLFIGYPEREDESEGIFDSIASKIGDVVDWGEAQFMVRKAILAGTLDENQLTNLVFSARHPKRQGRKLSKDEPNFPQLSEEWLAIRDRIVRPILDKPTTGVKPLPTGSACATTGLLYPDVSTLLPKSGIGFRSRTVDRYGLSETINALLQVGMMWQSNHPKGPIIVISDISKECGGKLPTHKSHRIGLDVDLGFRRNQAKPGGSDRVCTIDSDYKSYWRSLIQDLVNTIRSNGVLKVKQIGFADKTMAGTSFWDDHLCHLHVRFCMPPKYKARLDLSLTYGKGKKPDYSC